MAEAPATRPTCKRRSLFCFSASALRTLGRAARSGPKSGAGGMPTVHGGVEDDSRTSDFNTSAPTPTVVGHVGSRRRRSSSSSRGMEGPGDPPPYRRRVVLEAPWCLALYWNDWLKTHWMIFSPSSSCWSTSGSEEATREDRQVDPSSRSHARTSHADRSWSAH